MQTIFLPSSFFVCVLLFVKGNYMQIRVLIRHRLRVSKSVDFHLI